VIDIAKETGLGVTRADRHVERLLNGPDRGVAAPHLDLGHDPHRFTQLEEITVARCRIVERNHFTIRNTGRRRGDAGAAETGDHVHVALCLLETGGTFSRVIDDPFGKANRALDGEAVVIDALFQIVERTAGRDILVQLAEPGLDAFIAGLARDLDLLGGTQLLPADRGHVQTEAETLRFFFSH